MSPESPKRRVQIFDTTLRDGEQSPGATMNVEEKLVIARQLEKLGVDVIEAGFAASSDGDFESVQRVADAVKSPIVLSLARTREADITRGLKAVEKAARPGVHIFIATSEIHLKHKLMMSRQEVIDAAVWAVTFAKKHVDYVEFSAEDASRSDPEYLKEIFGAVIAAGARTINVPDTTGYAIPMQTEALFRKLVSETDGGDKVIWSAHCHNDLGLAVANSLAAVGAGARQVECTINGLGERAGNAALEEIVMALRTRPDRMPYHTRINSEVITKASRLVSAITGFVVQPNKAIVGANAFAHESGIHQDGMLKHAGTYEIMTPESVGLTRSTLVMGKHSGRHAFRTKLKELGFDLGDNALNDAFQRFKDLADKKKEVFDEDIIALVDDEIARGNDRIRFVGLQVVAGTRGPQRAELELEIDGVRSTNTATGDGPVDAIFKAIKMGFPHDARLVLFHIQAVTEGTDAQAEVMVRLEEGGKTVNGQGADTDTLVASCKAYLHALNKLLVKRQKTAPAALTA